MSRTPLSTTPLSTPRDFLTSLFNTLTSTPALTPSTANRSQPQEPQPNTETHALPRTRTSHPSEGETTNPLKALPPSHRALLTTLHVLFPPPTLLQALDLLDRGLVTRLTLSPTPTTEPTPALPPEPVTNAPSVQLPPHLYLVRSAQAPRGRFKDPTAASLGAMKSYTVRLEAWNCTCAAFAFAAFPGGGAGLEKPWRSTVVEGEEGEEEEDVQETERKWEWGGRSRDGTASGNSNGHVPVCKHLLACVLAERWDGVLGVYVQEREVDREEMAGVGGES